MNELKPMHDPPHPGELIAEVYLTTLGISGRELAKRLDVSPSTLSRVLSGASRVTPEMALRLSKALGRSAESWLAMQDAHDLWGARQSLDLDRVHPIAVPSA
ncbi:HigA family addiction module antitoxin [Agromyces silvae]|uniref:HigA family addiction module antitoxin n=1 Tax=Agromyces silvae TaxID=3388266 RepID=UPI00280B391E|nr:HigA family addiction module antitoxin [Agromyces protaetiae]